MLLAFENLCDSLAPLFKRPIATVLLLVLAITCLCLQHAGADPDLFARLAVGRLFFEIGHMPIHDPFAYSPRKELWVDHEWLSGVIFYLIHQWAGDYGLFVFKLFAAAASLACLIKAREIYAGRHSSDLLWALVFGVSCWYVWGSTVRSQAFTYFFIPVLLLAFVKFEVQGRNALMLALPLVMLFWANAHGGFVVGLGFIGLFSLWQLLRGHRQSLLTASIFLACFVATWLTPYPVPTFWSFIFDAALKTRSYISEWRAIKIFAWEGIWPNLLVLVLSLGALVNRKQKQDWFGAALIVVTTVEGYRNGRLLAIFFMVALVYGTPWYRALSPANIFERFGISALKINRASSFLLACFALSALMFAGVRLARPTLFRLDTSGYPVQALNWLAEHEHSGRLLVHFNYGSYALYVLYPRFLVSLDGRYEELYTDQTFYDGFAALNPKAVDFRAAFQRLMPDFILLESQSDAFQQRAAFGDEWQVVYNDPKFSLLAKSPAGSSAH